MKLVATLVAATLTCWGVVPAYGHEAVRNADARSDALQAVAPVQTSAAARDFTMRLLAGQAGQARLKSAIDQSRALQALVDLAKQRLDVLDDLIDSDPAEVLRVALPASIRASLRAEVQAYVEQEAEETGEIEVLHVDHVDATQDRYVHFLNTPKGRYSLHFVGSAPDIASGASARVRGVRIGEAIVVAGTDLVVDKVAAVPNTKGPQKTLAILVNFANAPTQPFSVSTAQTVFFTNTSAFDYEVSYQQTTLTGAVAGWFTIATSSTTCDYTAIATQAKAAATNAGYVLSNYARLVYVFPSNACTWWGLGSVGGTPSQAWIHTKWGLSHKIVGHEMGHNLGLFHAHSLDCGSASVATSGCTASEYGDVFDLMGSASSGGHYNVYQKERLGWLNDGVSPPITTAAATAGTATYDIAPLEDARNTLPRALKIPRATACTPNTEWLYVEARQARGYDSFLGSNANVLSGVIVHKVTDGARDGYLLDMTPSTTAWGDAALVAGTSFTDPQSGLRISTVSAGSGGARVSVTFPAASCTRAAPAVSITPSGTVWTAAGQSVSYAVQTQNRDSCGCAPTNFDVSAIVPGGWSATSARTASVAPGATTVSSILVTTSASAVTGFYPVTLKSTNVVAPTMNASAAGTVAIDTVAVTQEPTQVATMGAVVTTDKSTYNVNRRSISARITTSVKSGGAALAGASVSVDVRDPTGRITTLTGITGSDGSVTLGYLLGTASARGTYAVTSRATKNSSSATAAAAFAVN